MYQKISGIEKFFCMSEKGYHDFLSKIFCLTGPKNFVRGPFCVSEIFWYGKKNKLMDKRWGFHVAVEDFLSHSAKKFRGGTLQCFRKIQLSKNFMHRKRISLFFVESFLSHSAEKIRRWTLPYFKKITVSKIFMHKREGHHGIVEKSFVSRDWNEKLRTGTLLLPRKIMVSKKFYG